MSTHARVHTHTYAHREQEIQGLNGRQIDDIAKGFKCLAVFSVPSLLVSCVTECKHTHTKRRRQAEERQNFSREREIERAIFMRFE